VIARRVTGVLSLVWGLAALACTMAGAAAADSGSPAVGHASQRPPARLPAVTEKITFGNTTCAPSWLPPSAGRASFRVVNQSARTATVYLYRSDTGTVLSTIHHMRPGSKAVVEVVLEPGARYRWSCDLRGVPVHLSDGIRVPATGQSGRGAGPSVLPVTATELEGPLHRYRGYVRVLLRRLLAQTAALGSATRAGSLRAAETDWLHAHLTWLAIGQDDGAYGSFGDLGREIDGTAAGLVDGASGKDFTGFHRVELDLFKQQSLNAAASDAAHLRVLVAHLADLSLQHEMPGNVSGLLAFCLRVHEVLEDGLRDTLSGDDDYGSGTGLASIRADVTATREFLTLLAPLIDRRRPALVGTARHRLDALVAALGGGRTADGAWIAIAMLPITEREDVDGAIGAALESLARIPDLLRIGHS
jgi:high-affinity iron transporter